MIRYLGAGLVRTKANICHPTAPEGHHDAPSSFKAALIASDALLSSARNAYAWTFKGDVRRGVTERSAVAVALAGFSTAPGHGASGDRSLFPRRRGERLRQRASCSGRGAACCLAPPRFAPDRRSLGRSPGSSRRARG
jgi:hypothetical protein